MKKRVLLRSLPLLTVILLAGVCFYWLSYDMDRLPEGVETARCVSPDGKYVLILYESETSLSSPALRGEILECASGKRRNIYWQYRPAGRDCVWVDNETVRINGITLNIHHDRYDYRRDKSEKNVSPDLP